MKVSCIDRYKLERTHAYFGVELGNNIFEVFSIANFKMEKNYLLRFPNDNFRWFSSSLFKVINDSIPHFWVHKKFSLFSVLKNKKYDFSILLGEYWGPEEFLNNEDFLFDIHEEPERADNFANEIIRKYIETKQI